MMNTLDLFFSIKNKPRILIKPEDYHIISGYVQ